MNKKFEKEDILDKTVHLIRKQGYADTGIQAIMKASGVSKGTFYNYFKTKEDYGVALLDYYGDCQRVYIQQFVGSSAPGSPLTQLKAFYTDMIEQNTLDGLDAGCLLNNMSMEAAGNSEALAQAADRNFNKWMGVLTPVVEAGQSANEITTTFEAREIAEYLHSSFNGGMSRMKAVRSAKPLQSMFAIAFEAIKAKAG